MPLEELKGHFDGLMGEDSREILKLCDLEYLAENMRCLVHHSTYWPCRPRPTLFQKVNKKNINAKNAIKWRG